MLAFGNGAPDVFASVLAAKKFQLELALGSLVGSSLFITSVVVSIVILTSGKSKVDRTKFLRDAGTLLLTVLIILVYGFIERIELFQASVFLLLYIIYAATVIYTEKSDFEAELGIMESPVHSKNFIESPKMIVHPLPGPEMHEKHIKSSKEPLSLSASIQWSFIKFKFFWEKS